MVVIKNFIYGLFNNVARSSHYTYSSYASSKSALSLTCDHHV